MPTRLFPYALLFLSWLLAAFAGARIAAYNAHSAFASGALALRGLDIVGSDGKPRISLQTVQDQPVVLLHSAAGTEALRLDVAPSEQPWSGVPHLQIFDPSGTSAIELFGFRGPRGLLSFSSPDRVEGKLMLGHFGITDDGTDTGMWGLKVSGAGKYGHTERSLGVVTVNGKDTGFVWPLYPEELPRKLKP